MPIEKEFAALFLEESIKLNPKNLEAWIFLFEREFPRATYDQKILLLEKFIIAFRDNPHAIAYVIQSPVCKQIFNSDPYRLICYLLNDKEDGEYMDLFMKNFTSLLFRESQLPGNKISYNEKNRKKIIPVLVDYFKNDKSSRKSRAATNKTLQKMILRLNKNPITCEILINLHLQLLSLWGNKIQLQNSLDFYNKNIHSFKSQETHKSVIQACMTINEILGNSRECKNLKEDLDFLEGNASNKKESLQ